MTPSQTPRWARITALVASIWYAFGLSQAMLAYVTDVAAAPMLIWLAYGVACVAGLIGSIAMFVGSLRASAAFGGSLLSAVVYFGWLFARGAPTSADYGIGAVVIAVTALLFLVSRRLGAPR